MTPFRYWTCLLGTLAALLAAVWWSGRLPAPVPASAPAAAFSAARAWPTLAYLADTVGYRVNGTPAAERALAHLADRLRALWGWEVEVQDVAAVRPSTWFGSVVAFRTKNLLARFPGSARDAVLVSAHYDSPPESVGASDDAASVAVVLELARALATAPRQTNTVIVNLNGAEEQGL